MRLTETQIGIIRSYVSSSGIRLKTLQDDVVDHLCCVLEQSKNEHLSFEEQLQKSTEELAPDGLSNLERQTVYLLNHKKILYMKKLMYLVGLGSSMALAIGVCFRILNWKGGSELLIYGFLSFTLLFLPMTIIDRLRVRIQKSLSLKLQYLMGSLSAILAGVAVLLKILHLPGADQMLLIAAITFSFGFLPFLFFTNYRKAVQRTFSNIN